MTKSVTAGDIVKLRIQFKDDLGKPTEAQNVSLFIFQPGIDTSDNTLSIDSNGFTPTYLGEGVYEHQYTTPCTPVGEWSEKWTGDLICQAGLTATMTFTLVAGASELVAFEGPQLFDNNLVSIKLLPGIASTAGDVFTEELEIEFLTNVTPSYSNLTKVNLEVGSLITGVKDLTSALSILEASLEADSLSFASTEINSDLFKHARREYVTAASSFKLVSNIGGNLLKSKALGDLSVTYDTASHKDTLEHLQEMMRKWGDQLMSGGGAREIRSPKGVVKGSLDSDRPSFDRMWEPTSSTNKMPVGNSSGKTISGRRSLRTYKKRWW
ncbi:MAG: hypothetical protein CMB80_04380 [Flammeovirgaceae bacterium]|nr:hypothetical protein [Flammeovirgaceae bacterium]